MTLRKNVLLSLAIVAIGLTILFYVLTNLILLNGFVTVEKSSATQEMQKILTVLSLDIDQVSEVTWDWAEWDDTYAFVETRSQEYISSNLVDESFIHNRLNVILYFNTSGNLVYGKEYNYAARMELPLSKRLLATLLEYNLILNISESKQVKGIILTPDGPLIFTASPILKSTGEGPIRGRLIMGRFLDKTVTDRIGSILSCPIEVFSINGNQNAPDVGEVFPLLKAANAPIVIPINNNQIYGYALVRDIAGEPSIILRTTLPRPLFGQGQITTLYLFISLFIATVAFWTMGLVTVEHFVLSRISNLSEAVKKIEKSGNLDIRIPTTGDDELTTFADNMNKMLISLQHYQGEIQKSESRYRAVVENQTELICRFVTGEKLTFVNDAFCRFFGKKPEELIGQSFFSLIAEEDIEQVKRYIGSLNLNNPVVSYEHRVVLPSGSVKWLQWTDKALFDLDGKIIEFQSSGRDITLLKEANEAVRIQNKQLITINQIISTVTQAITLDDLLKQALQKTLDMLEFTFGTIYRYNSETKQANLEAYLGIPTPLVTQYLNVAKTIDATRPPHEAVFKTMVPQYFEDISGDIPKLVDLSIYSKLNLTSLAIIPLNAESAVLGAMYIAKQRHHKFTPYEKEMLASIGKELGNALLKGVLQDKLVGAMTKADINSEIAERANREANFYLDIMTHDINNVNQATLGYTMLLADVADEPQKDFVRKLENTVLKSSEIIHDVSTIRRIREKEPTLKSVLLDPVIKNNIKHFADAQIQFEGTDVAVCADDLISEIFLNLIGNSLKFGGINTKVAIKVETKDSQVIVSIEDNGPGIPNDLKPFLFSRFQRGSTEKSGKGLGLYIVKMLVERYGGTVSVEDAVSGHPESGAIVKFTLKKVDNC